MLDAFLLRAFQAGDARQQAPTERQAVNHVLVQADAHVSINIIGIGFEHLLLNRYRIVGVAHSAHKAALDGGVVTGAQAVSRSLIIERFGVFRVAAQTRLRRRERLFNQLAELAVALRVDFIFVLILLVKRAAGVSRSRQPAALVQQFEPQVVGQINVTGRMSGREPGHLRVAVARRRVIHIIKRVVAFLAHAVELGEVGGRAGRRFRCRGRLR